MENRKFKVESDLPGAPKYQPAECGYHSSWDWLMPVVEKIALDNSLFEMSMGNVNTCTSFHETEMESNPKPIESVYNSVINWIKFHNSKSPQP